MEEILNGNTYTKQEVADKLHVTIMTINNYIKAGKLKAVKVGNRRVLITENAFNDFVKENTRAI